AYQYCGGDPVGKVDPSGEAAKAPLTGMTFSKRDRIRWLALAWVNRSIPYLYGAKYFFHYTKWDKYQGKSVDAYHRLDCSGFVQRILNEAGVRGIPSISRSVNNSWKSTDFYSQAPRQGRSNADYFDAAKKTHYQIGDILYASEHVAIVISNGKNPEIAECTPWPKPGGWKDGTKKTRLATRWSSWKPTSAGRYIAAYAPNALQ
ncbi:MAG: NlpC/P60 family protein, partial [Anaerosomatales bacterium]|nr:NlpC/P60 family protein [Anaerosomatales bacterium]